MGLPYGTLSYVDLGNNTGGVPVIKRVMTDRVQWTNPVAGSETAVRTIALMGGGTLADLLILDPTLNAATVTIKNANTSAAFGQLDLRNTAGTGQSLITFTSGAGVLWGSIRVDYVGGMSIKAGLSGNLILYGGGVPGVTVASTGAVIVGGAGSPTMGFFGATGTAKPAVTGSRGANAALASLLTTLANLGLLTDSSTI